MTQAGIPEGREGSASQDGEEEDRGGAWGNQGVRRRQRRDVSEGTLYIERGFCDMDRTKEAAGSRQ